ncbi:probable carbohydrate esterase At4g34215 [Olea europaea subsp. europaea]|uniref:Probable carbohydrate esterase At4g34215 n=1 Tax=Olea europaea subsp. europaea TaxID=158383 RepID=A0A8S0URA7_OLEEU|nr:probable carbohydrate esterase At4g34215 [Olea europaea subsp. europaea]
MSGRGSVINGSWRYIPWECRSQPLNLQLITGLTWEMAFRADLSLPNLPIIPVALASEIRAYFDIIREAQSVIKLPNVIAADAKGL